jgi:hypothetical protein
MVRKTNEGKIPPYIGWSTWNRLIEDMRTFIPSRLDRSYFNSLGFSGTQYSQAIRALSFLGLMDETKKPNEKFRQLVMGTEDERKAILKSVVEEAYKPFFEDPGSENATLGDLLGFLRSQGARGVVDKCVTFFLSAAKETGIPLSPQLSGEFGRRTGQRTKGQRKKSAKQRGSFAKPPQEQTAQTFLIDGIDPEVISYVAEVPEEKQDNWIKAYVKIKKALHEGGTQADKK